MNTKKYSHTINSLIRSNKIVNIQRKQMVIVMFLMLGGIIISMVLPFVLTDLINAMTSINNIKMMGRLLAFYLSINLLRVILQYVINVVSNILKFNTCQSVKFRIVDCLFSKKGKFFCENKAGELLKYLDHDAGVLASFVFNAFDIFTDLIMSISTMCVLAYLELELLLILLGLIPVVIIIQNKINKSILKYSEQSRKVYGDQGALLTEFISNALPMITFGVRRLYLNKLQKINDNLVSKNKTLMIVNEISNSLIGLFIVLASMISLSYGCVKILHGTLDIGTVITFVQYSNAIISPIITVLTLRAIANHITPSLERLEKLMETGICELVRNKMFEKLEPIRINVVDVCFAYTDKKYILSKVNLNFIQGKKYAIIGKSGEGKSTFLNLLTGLWTVTSGEILINGVNINDLELDSLRKYISIVSQDPFFFNDSIRENLDLYSEYSDEYIWNVLQRVEMKNDVLEMPEGIHTLIGDKGLKLSVGQRQRLAIGRAIIKKAPIIIFDEPTSSLDDITEKVIMDTLDAIKDKLVIIVTHKKKILNIVDEILEIQQSKVYSVELNKI